MAIRFIVEVGDDFVPEDGDVIDALCDALTDAGIPASIIISDDV